MAKGDHEPDQTRILGALQNEINAKLMAAKIAQEADDAREAERLRKIAALWQQVHDGTT